MRRLAPLLLAAVLTACGGGSGPTDASPAEPTLPVDQRPEYLRSTEPCEPPAEHSIAPARDVAELALEPMVQLEMPTVLAFNTDGRAYLAERDGRIFVWDGAGVPVEVLDLSDRTGVENDQGLVGMTVSPDDRWLYLNQTLTTGASRVVAHRIVDGVPVADDDEEILFVDQPSRLHNGGDLAFAPDDTLYVSFGDGGGLGDRFYNGQDPSTRLGSVLRLDPRPGETPAFSTPPDNPFVDDPATDDLIWAMGVRNPFRFSFDDETGDFWLADLGQQCVEEINRLTVDEAGANLGWNVFEASVPFVGSLAAGEVHRAPDFEYWHTDGWCAVVGGHVYRGSAMPELIGTYVFADLCKGSIVLLDPVTMTARESGASTERPVDLAVDPDGELWVVSMAGQVSRLVPPT